MTVSPEQVRQIAELARLELGEEEARTLAAQLDGILDHLDVLRAVDAQDVEADPPPATPLRPDRVGADPLHRPPAEVAPAWEDGFFVAPRVEGLGGEGGDGAP